MTDNPLLDLHVFIEEMLTSADAEDYTFQEDRSAQQQLTDILEALDADLTQEEEGIDFSSQAEQIIGFHATVVPLSDGATQVRIAPEEHPAVTINKRTADDDTMEVWDRLTEDCEFAWGMGVEDEEDEDEDRYDNPDDEEDPSEREDNPAAGNIVLKFPNRWSVSLLPVAQDGPEEYVEAQVLDPEGNAWSRNPILTMYPERVPEFLLNVRDTNERTWAPPFFNHLLSLVN